MAKKKFLFPLQRYSKQKREQGGGGYSIANLSFIISPRGLALTKPFRHQGPVYERFVDGSVPCDNIIGISVPDVYLYAIPPRSLRVTSLTPHRGDQFNKMIDDLFSFLDETKTCVDLEAWEDTKEKAKQGIESLSYASEGHDSYLLKLNQILMNVVLSSFTPPKDRPLTVLDLVRHWAGDVPLYTIQGKPIAPDFNPVVEIPSVPNELCCADISRVLVLEEKLEACDEIWAAIAGRKDVLNLYGISDLSYCFRGKKSPSEVEHHISTKEVVAVAGISVGEVAGEVAERGSSAQVEPPALEIEPPIVIRGGASLVTRLYRIINPFRRR